MLPFHFQLPSSSLFNSIKRNIIPYSIELFNDDEIIEKFNLGDVHLRYSFREFSRLNVRRLWGFWKSDAERRDAVMDVRWVWPSFCRFSWRVYRLGWRRWDRNKYDRCCTGWLGWCCNVKGMTRWITWSVIYSWIISCLFNSWAEWAVCRIFWSIVEVRNMHQLRKSRDPAYLISSFISMCDVPGGLHAEGGDVHSRHLH